jgi:hypothetical protein
MTPNDKQIDLLMRRYGPSANRATGGEHLDADEMNAFAEGGLPAASRARYVSHLADCDQCRQTVSQVTLSGAVSHRAEPAGEKSRPALWKTLTGLFALPVLRYAAVAAVLLIVAGVAFIAFRRQKPTDLVAVNETTNQQPVTATKTETSGNENKQISSATPPPVAQPTAAGEVPKVAETTKAPTTTVPTTSTLKDAPATSEAEKKAAEPAVAAKAPAYSPPPPGDAQSGARDQQGVGGTLAARKGESTDKLATQQITKETGRKDETSGFLMNQPAAPRQRDEKGKGPSRNLENLRGNQTANETSRDAPRTSGADNNRTSTEEAPATRSAGGRTFRKQGGAWVDQKFKSSMTLRSVSRGSEEFSALDSGLRSIAQQLGGEIIVVWKGHAYLIK